MQTEVPVGWGIIKARMNKLFFIIDTIEKKLRVEHKYSIKNMNLNVQREYGQWYRI